MYIYIYNVICVDTDNREGTNIRESEKTEPENLGETVETYTTYENKYSSEGVSYDNTSHNYHLVKQDQEINQLSLTTNPQNNKLGGAIYIDEGEQSMDIIENKFEIPSPLPVRSQGPFHEYIAGKEEALSEMHRKTEYMRDFLQERARKISDSLWEGGQSERGEYSQHRQSKSINSGAFSTHRYLNKLQQSMFENVGSNSGCLCSSSCFSSSSLSNNHRIVFPEVKEGHHPREPFDCLDDNILRFSGNHASYTFGGTDQTLSGNKLNNTRASLNFQSELESSHEFLNKLKKYSSNSSNDPLHLLTNKHNNNTRPTQQPGTEEYSEGCAEWEYERKCEERGNSAIIENNLSEETEGNVCDVSATSLKETLEAKWTEYKTTYRVGTNNNNITNNSKLNESANWKKMENVTAQNYIRSQISKDLRSKFKNFSLSLMDGKLSSNTSLNDSSFTASRSKGYKIIKKKYLNSIDDKVCELVYVLRNIIKHRY